jgi:hypothetical protein
LPSTNGPSTTGKGPSTNGPSPDVPSADRVADAPPIVVIISVDPRTSHRANEAMRIGLGVTAGDNTVTFILRGPAVHLLDDDTDELVDGDDVARFRSALRGLDIPFHVERPAIPNDADWNAEGHAIVPVSTEDMAILVSRGRRFIFF